MTSRGTAAVLFWSTAQEEEDTFSYPGPNICCPFPGKEAWCPPVSSATNPAAW